jgi:hypothetical protein
MQPSGQPTGQPTGQQHLRILPEKRYFKQNIFLFGTITDVTQPFKNINVSPGNLGTNRIILGNSSNPGTVDISWENQSFVLSTSYGLSHDTTTRSLALVQDLNGDSHNDLLIGCPFESRVHVSYGTNGDTNLFQAVKGFSIYGTTEDYLGWAVEGAGDMNGDGLGDMIMSALLVNKVYVIFGQLGGRSRDLELSLLTRQEGIVISGHYPLSSVGMAVCSAGDFNGDGRADIAISAKSTAQNNIFIVLGNASLPAEIELYSYKGGLVTYASGGVDFAGVVLDGVGDMNGDGLDDVVVGSVPRTGYGGTASSSQKSFVVYGSRTLNGKVVRLDQLSSQQGFVVVGAGIGVSGIGDVNGDGFQDILVNSYDGWQGESASYVMVLPSPFTTSPSPSPTVTPTVRPSVNVSAGSNLTQHPSEQPTTPAPSYSPSLRPSRSRSPSLSPTSLKPSRAPVLPSKKPSAVPTLMPSPRPSRNILAPSSFPTSRPTINKREDFTSITYITTGGLYLGNWTKTEIRINSPTNVVINIEDNRVNKFKIYPQPNMTIVFNDFNDLNLLDLSLFTQFSSMGELSYSTDPLTILLPDGQKLVFPQISSFNLHESNFIFDSEQQDTNSSSSSKRGFRIPLLIGSNAVVLLGVLVGLSALVLFLFRGSRVSKNTRQKILSMLPKTESALPWENPNLQVRRNRIEPMPSTGDRKRDLESLKEDDDEPESSSSSNSSSSTSNDGSYEKRSSSSAKNKIINEDGFLPPAAFNKSRRKSLLSPVELSPVWSSSASSEHENYSDISDLSDEKDLPIETKIQRKFTRRLTKALESLVKLQDIPSLIPPATQSSLLSDVRSGPVSAISAAARRRSSILQRINRRASVRPSTLKEHPEEDEEEVDIDGMFDGDELGDDLENGSFDSMSSDALTEMEIEEINRRRSIAIARRRSEVPSFGLSLSPAARRRSSLARVNGLIRTNAQPWSVNLRKVSQSFSVPLSAGANMGPAVDNVTVVSRPESHSSFSSSNYSTGSSRNWDEIKMSRSSDDSFSSLKSSRGPSRALSARSRGDVDIESQLSSYPSSLLLDDDEEDEDDHDHDGDHSTIDSADFLSK